MRIEGGRRESHERERYKGDLLVIKWWTRHEKHTKMWLY